MLKRNINYAVLDLKCSTNNRNIGFVRHTVIEHYTFTLHLFCSLYLAACEENKFKRSFDGTTGL